MKPLILSALIVMTLNAKDHKWAMGKLIDTDVTTTYDGQVGHNGNTAPIDTTMETVVIAGDDYSAPLGRFYQEYTAQRTLRGLRKKADSLIVNTPVKFAVEKRKLYIVDDDGRKYEVDIIKQVQKEAR